MKNTTNIKELITLYFEGKTTAEQESFLKEFFSQKDIPEVYKRDQRLMQALFQMDHISIPSNLEQKLHVTISNLALKEKQHKVFPLNKWKWISVAATLIIAISLPLYVIQITQQEETAQLSLVDKNKILEAQKALLLLSKNYNKGLEQLTISQETISESTHALNKHLIISNQ